MSFLDEVKEKLKITEKDIEKFNKESEYRNNCTKYFFSPHGIKGTSSFCAINGYKCREICIIDKDNCDKYQKK